MDYYKNQSLIETVLFILWRTGGLDMYHIFKILYFAEKEALSELGISIINDNFAALQYGPVPSRLYNAISKNTYADKNLVSLFYDNISQNGEDARDIFIAKREPNMDYIAPAAVPILEKSINENKSLTFNELVHKSHDTAWKRAKDTPTRAMNMVDIAEAAGCNEEYLDYVREMQEIENCFSR